ncbi:MAG: hypothetical protein ACI9UT_003247 [Flavobacteriales bacterium]
MGYFLAPVLFFIRGQLFNSNAIDRFSDLATEGFIWSFVIIFSGLCSMMVVAGVAIKPDKNNDFLYDVGMQAANGISILAMTFTLLGISLGIGCLSEQPVTPSSVKEIIGELTKQFSMVFMTTVVGLQSWLYYVLGSACDIKIEKENSIFYCRFSWCSLFNYANVGRQCMVRRE